MENKIFGKRQKIELAVMASALVVLCAAIAFASPESSLSRIGLFADLLFGFSAFVVSASALLIGIQTYRRDEKTRREKLQADAKKFINENARDINLLPLCVVANAYDNHRKYFREIYNRFCVLDDELQEEILKQTKYAFSLTCPDGWVEEANLVAGNFVKSKSIGLDFFSSAFGLSDFAERHPGEHTSDVRGQLGMSIPGTDKYCSLESYLDEYLAAEKTGGDRFKEYEDKRPFDLLFGTSKEGIKDAYRFSRIAIAMTVVVSRIIEKSKGKASTEKLGLISMKYSMLCTVEDVYLYLLMHLYNLHLVSGKSKRLPKKKYR